MNPEPSTLALVPFRAELAPQVLGWVRTADELANWCARTDFPLTDAAVFASWHADPDVRAYALMSGERPCCYGEIWVDAEEREVELARILVAPDLRNQGLGKRLVALLTQAARSTGLDATWVRVVPANLAAIACYVSAGFSRASPEQEKAFNAPQPKPYVWLRRSLLRDAADQPPTT